MHRSLPLKQVFNRGKFLPRVWVTFQSIVLMFQGNLPWTCNPECWGTREHWDQVAGETTPSGKLGRKGSSVHFGCPLVVCWFSLENAYCNDPIKSETLVLSVSQKVLLSPAPPKSSNWPPFCDPPTGIIQFNSATKWRKTDSQLQIWTV